MFPEVMSLKRNRVLRRQSELSIAEFVWKETSELRALPLIAGYHDVEPSLVHYLKWWEAPNRLKNTVKWLSNVRRCVAELRVRATAAYPSILVLLIQVVK